MFKLALDRLPAGEELCSQSAISRLENLPDRRALLRLGRALVEQYCGSFRAVPKHRPRYRRHLRPRAWRPATAPIQRRLRLPADRCARCRGPFCHRTAAAQQAAARGGDPRLCAPPDRRPAQPLAKGRDPAARRQPLCLRFGHFHDAAQSWSRVERIIARVEAGLQGSDTRFIVTSLEGGRAKHLYQRLYCARGRAENHIKAWG